METCIGDSAMGKTGVVHSASVTRSRRILGRGGFSLQGRLEPGSSILPADSIGNKHPTPAQEDFPGGVNYLLGGIRTGAFQSPFCATDTPPFISDFHLHDIFSARPRERRPTCMGVHSSRRR